MIGVVAAIVSSSACASRSPAPAARAIAPKNSLPIHAEIRDTSVDALPDVRVPVSPDLVMAIVDVDAEEVEFKLRTRPGSFDAATTRFVIDLDVDHNASTGIAGVEYQVFVFPASGKGGADVATTTTAGYTVVGSVPVTFVADGCDVAIPLSLLGADDGRFDFRVRVYSQPALPVVIDTLPDNGFVRID